MPNRLTKHDEISNDIEKLENKKNKEVKEEKVVRRQQSLFDFAA